MAEIVPLPNQNPESDRHQEGNSGQGSEHLNLSGIARPGDPACTAGARSNAGTDNYFHYGETGAVRGPADWQQHQFDRGDQQPADYGNAPESRVTLQSGQTFWDLAADKYNGHYPIEAIYAANGLKPSVSQDGSGQITLSDPTYYAGKEYVLPAAQDVPKLIDQYRQSVADEGGYSAQRVGDAQHCTDVKLIYGDTFSKLAQAKYGDSDNPPIEAIYEANNLKPKVIDNNGQISFEDPTYYAGKTYVLPAAADIPQLERNFYNDIGHPELCPEQYQSGVGNNGQPGNDTQQPPAQPSAAPQCADNGNNNLNGYGGTQSEMEWRQGYRTGYRDAVADDHNTDNNWINNNNGNGGYDSYNDFLRAHGFAVTDNGAPQGQPNGNPQVVVINEQGPVAPPGYQGAPPGYQGAPPGYQGYQPGFQGGAPGVPGSPDQGGWYGYDGTAGAPQATYSGYAQGYGSPNFVPNYSDQGPSQPTYMQRSAYQGEPQSASDPRYQQAIAYGMQADEGQGPTLRVAGGQFDNGQSANSPYYYNPDNIAAISSPGGWSPLSNEAGGPTVNYGGEDGSADPYRTRPNDQSA